VCIGVCMCVCLCACVRVCVYVCVYVYLCVFLINALLYHQTKAPLDHCCAHRNRRRFLRLEAAGGVYKPVCVCVHACEFVRMRVYVCMRVSAFACVCMRVHACAFCGNL
jgi:hypothetical protein